MTPLLHNQTAPDQSCHYFIIQITPPRRSSRIRAQPRKNYRKIRQPDPNDTSSEDSDIISSDEDDDYHPPLSPHDPLPPPSPPPSPPRSVRESDTGSSDDSSDFTSSRFWTTHTTPITVKECTETGKDIA